MLVTLDALLAMSPSDFGDQFSAIHIRLLANPFRATISFLTRSLPCCDLSLGTLRDESALDGGKRLEVVSQGLHALDHVAVLSKE